MRFNHKTSLCVSAVVFAALLYIGFLLSQHKLLWIDECTAQHLSVEKPSYVDLLTFRIPAQLNQCPLFYILQKINSDIFSFRYHGMPSEGSNDISDLRSQIIMRIPSNIYMSLALAGIFYYFMRFFSLFAAIFALIAALVSPMVWMYWVEARPYSLWFLLTTVQLLLFCVLIQSPKIKVKSSLSLVHILLVLTTSGSIIQIFIVSFLLYYKKIYNLRQLLWLLFLPFCMFILYHLFDTAVRVRTFNFYITFFEAVMPERLPVYVIYALTAWGVAQRRKEFFSNTFFLPVFLLFLIGGYCALYVNIYTRNFDFGFFSRYIICLVPADILMFSLASADLLQWTRKNRWVCMNVSIFLAGLTIIRGLMTYREIIATALYSHSSI